jgi:orotate phosphoribosyltransferase
MYERIKNDRLDAVGGLTLGADPVIGSLISYSAARGTPLNGFIVRKEEKKHGMGKLLEGPALSPSARVAILDDVVTTGSSTIKAIQAVQRIGCAIIRVIAVVDRQEGAAEAVSPYGVTLESLFTIKDFLDD